MLIPRFTLRWLMLLITVISVFCVIVAQAFRGHAWALGISLAAASLMLAFLTYGVFFCLAASLAALWGLHRQDVGVASPFATVEPPPQIIPPEDPE
jgi:antibiotic biosynthesis monooxygenase (ABM) superfamily enzyme